MSSSSSQSGESIDNSSKTTATSSESQRKLWERLPTDVNWFGRLVEFNCNGNALDDDNGSSRESVRSQNADARSEKFYQTHLGSGLSCAFRITYAPRRIQIQTSRLGFSIA